MRVGEIAVDVDARAQVVIPGASCLKCGRAAGVGCGSNYVYLRLICLGCEDRALGRPPGLSGGYTDDEAEGICSESLEVHVGDWQVCRREFGHDGSHLTKKGTAWG